MIKNFGNLNKWNFLRDNIFNKKNKFIYTDIILYINI